MNESCSRCANKSYRRRSLNASSTDSLDTHSDVVGEQRRTRYMSMCKLPVNIEILSPLPHHRPAPMFLLRLCSCCQLLPRVRVVMRNESLIQSMKMHERNEMATTSAFARLERQMGLRCAESPCGLDAVEIDFENKIKTRHETARMFAELDGKNYWKNGKKLLLIPDWHRWNFRLHEKKKSGRRSKGIVW